MRRRDVIRGVPGALGAAGGCVSGHGSPSSDREGSPDDDGDGSPDDDGERSQGTASQSCTYHNPVSESRVFPDPSVVRAPDGAFDAYGTYHAGGDDDDRPLVPVLRSRELVDWTYLGPAFDERPDWRPGGGWAPDVATDDAGDRWLVHHGYERSPPWDGETPRRVLFLGPLTWRDGWPVAPDRTPPASAPCPRIEG